MLEEIGHIVHEADLADEQYDTPAAPGLDVLIRRLTLADPAEVDVTMSAAGSAAASTTTCAGEAASFGRP